MLTLFKTHVRTWIAGLRSHFFCAPPAGECEAGALGYYHPVLDEIGNNLNIWRTCNERDRDLAFRIAVEIADRLNKLEGDLDRVINFDKR